MDERSQLGFRFATQLAIGESQKVPAADESQQDVVADVVQLVGARPSLIKARVMALGRTFDLLQR